MNRQQLKNLTASVVIIEIFVYVLLRVLFSVYVSDIYCFVVLICGHISSMFIELKSVDIPFFYSLESMF